MRDEEGGRKLVREWVVHATRLSSLRSCLRDAKRKSKALKGGFDWDMSPSRHGLAGAQPSRMQGAAKTWLSNWGPFWGPCLSPSRWRAASSNVAHNASIIVYFPENGISKSVPTIGLGQPCSYIVSSTCRRSEDGRMTQEARCVR